MHVLELLLTNLELDQQSEEAALWILVKRFLELGYHPVVLIHRSWYLLSLALLIWPTGFDEGFDV